MPERFVNPELWELLRNLEMGKTDCLYVEENLNAAHEKALSLARDGALEEAAIANCRHCQLGTKLLSDGRHENECEGLIGTWDCASKSIRALRGGG